MAHISSLGPDTGAFAVWAHREGGGDVIIDIQASAANKEKIANDVTYLELQGLAPSSTSLARCQVTFRERDTVVTVPVLETPDEITRARRDATSRVLKLAF